MDSCLVHYFSVCLVGWGVQTIFVNWPSQMDAAHEIVMMINTLVHKQNKLKAKKKKISCKGHFINHIKKLLSFKLNCLESI